MADREKPGFPRPGVSGAEQPFRSGVVPTTEVGVTSVKPKRPRRPTEQGMTVGDLRRPALPKVDVELDKDIDKAFDRLLVEEGEENEANVKLMPETEAVPQPVMEREDSSVVVTSSVPPKEDPSDGLKKIGKFGTYFYIRDPKDKTLRKVKDD